MSNAEGVAGMYQDLWLEQRERADGAAFLKELAEHALRKAESSCAGFERSWHAAEDLVDTLNARVAELTAALRGILDSQINGLSPTLASLERAREALREAGE